MSKEQWVVFKTNQHTQTLFQYKGLPHEKSWSESTSLSPEDSRLYNSYSDGSAAVESFIEDHTMTLECDPLQAEQRIRELKQHILDLEVALINLAAHRTSCSATSLYHAIETMEDQR